MAVASSVGVFLTVIFANARSSLVERSLEATTSAALLVIFVLGALAGGGPPVHARRGSDFDDDASCVESGTAPVRWRLATR